MSGSKEQIGFFTTECLVGMFNGVIKNTPSSNQGNLPCHSATTVTAIQLGVNKLHLVLPEMPLKKFAGATVTLFIILKCGLVTK